MVAIPLDKINYNKVSKYANVLIFKEVYPKTKNVSYYLKPRSHALIYTRYVNYKYMYNLHPGVIFFFFATRSHVSEIFWTKPCINPLVWEDDCVLSETEVWTHVFHAF